ncbi:phosphotransferase [Saccharomonospora sp. NPDC006951]
MFQAPDADKVSALLAEHYDLGITGSTGLVPVEGGADVAATLWTATDSSGRRFAVKWSGSGSPAGLVLPAALSAALPGSTAMPIPSRTGALWVDAGGMRLSIMEWVAGTSALEAPLGPETWEAQGRLLATLHGLPVTPELREWVPREDFDTSRWAGLFERVDAAIGDGDAPDEPSSRLAEAWLRGRDDLRAVHDLTIRLGRVLRERTSLPGFVPCHADPHLGNVILTGEGPVLIDFDDAVLAPAERDLMFVLGGGVLADLPVTPEHQTDFLNGYGGVGGAREIDTELITYYRGLRTLEDIAEPASVVLDPAAPAEDREGNLGYVNDVLSPAGLLAQTLAGRGSL